MKTKNSFFKLTLTALFIAVMLVMNFTPLGYITTGLFSITLMTIPVAVGAVCAGVVPATVLGFIFGLTSFLQAFGIGYMIDPSAALLFSEKPLLYTLMCFAPRIITALAASLIFKAFAAKGKKGVIPIGITSLSVPILNTVLFLSSYIFFYRDTVLAGKTFMTVFISALTLNCLIEIAFTLVVATAISKALLKTISRLGHH